MCISPSCSQVSSSFIYFYVLFDHEPNHLRFIYTHFKLNDQSLDGKRICAINTKRRVVPSLLKTMVAYDLQLVKLTLANYTHCVSSL